MLSSVLLNLEENIKSDTVELHISYKKISRKFLESIYSPRSVLITNTCFVSITDTFRFRLQTDRYLHLETNEIRSLINIISPE